MLFLIGPSGSGKRSFVNYMCKLYGKKPYEMHILKDDMVNF